MKKVYKKLVTCSLAVLSLWPTTAVKAQTAVDDGQTFYAYRIDQLKKMTRALARTRTLVG